MSITDRFETWDAFEIRRAKNQLARRMMQEAEKPSPFQLVVNKPSRTDATKKHNARVMKKWKMGAL